MFGGSKGKIGEPYPGDEQYDAQAQEYWNAYGSWESAEKEKLDKDLLNAQESFGDDEEKYGAYLSQRRAAYDQQIDKFKATEQGQFLSDYMEKQNETESKGYMQDTNQSLQSFMGEGGGAMADQQGKIINKQIGDLENRLNTWDYSETLGGDAADRKKLNQLTTLRDSKPEPSTDMSAFFGERFGEPVAPQVAQEDEPVNDEAMTRARRAAAGGSSSWW